jgi:hypothetical protein
MIKPLISMAVRLLLLIVMSLPFSGANAQITLNQSFEDTIFPSPGWTSKAISGTGKFERVNSGSNPGCNPVHGYGMLRYASDTCAAGSKALLISPSFDLSNRGSNTPTVRFYMYRDNATTGSPDSMKVYVNTGDSLGGASLLGIINRVTSRTPVESADGWYAYSFNIPSGFTGSVNYILFNAVSAKGNNMFLDSITYTVYPPAMSYSSSTVTQNPLPVLRGGKNQPIIRIEVTGTGASNPLEVDGFNLNTNGNTFTSDIVRAGIFYSGSNPDFDSSTRFGSPVNAPSGSYSITGSQVLLPGINYFWLVYDIQDTAKAGDVLDAENPGISINGTTYAPAVTAPAGSNKMKDPMAGSYLIGANKDFTSLTLAAKELHALGLSTAVKFKLSSAYDSGAETFPILIKPFAGGSIANTLMIQPDANVKATISGNSSTSIIRSAAKYVIIDGSSYGGSSRDLSIHNTNPGDHTAVIHLSSRGAGAGASNNVIRSCNIMAGSAGYAAIGIFVGGNDINPNGYGYDNDSITLHNNYIRKAKYAICSRGGGADFYQEKLVITNNIIGRYFNYYFEGIGFRGIDVTQARNSTFSQNTIFCAMGNGNEVSRGIDLGSGVISSTVDGNLIHDLNQFTYTFMGAQGIVLGSGNAAADVTVTNNVIYSLFGYGGADKMTNSWGIVLANGGGYKIYHNSVNLSNYINSSSVSEVHGCLLVNDPTSTGLDIRNNVFRVAVINGNANIGQLYAVYSSAPNTAFTYINYNFYHVNGIRCFTGFLGSDRTSLGNWQTATGQDVNSKSSEPRFSNESNLRPAFGSPLKSAGTFLSAVTKDKTGATRSTTSPSVGAYEEAGDFIVPDIIFTPLTNAAVNTGRNFTAIITDSNWVDNTPGLRPRVYYKKGSDNNAYNGNSSSANGWKYVEASNGYSPYNFNIDYSILTGGGVSVGDSIQYFVVAQDDIATPNVAMDTGFFETPPTSVNLPASVFPVSGDLYTYHIATPLTGNYYIGNGQAFTSLTNPGGFFEFINRSVLGANVTAYITSDLIETGIVALNQFSESGSGNYTLSFKPADSTVKRVYGSCNGGLIRLNGADRVTFDGRYPGYPGNFLSISNTGSTPGNAAVAMHMISLGANKGARNNTVRNCNIYNDQLSSYGVIVGGVTTTMGGEDNDTISFMENYFGRSAFALKLDGFSWNNSNRIVVTNNTFGGNDTISLYGMVISNSQDVYVAGNILSTLFGQSGSIGMSIGGCTTVVAERNVLFNMGCKTSGVQSSVRGMYFAGSNITIRNNMVSGLAGNGGTDAVSGTHGIAILGNNFKVYHNTVNMNGNTIYNDSTISTAFYVGSGTSNVDARNNIFQNYTKNTVTNKARAYAIYCRSPFTAFSNLNYNDYAVDSGQGFVGFLGYAQKTLSNWRTVVGQDAKSVAVPVNLKNDFDDAHLGVNGAQSLWLRSIPVGGITTDFDGQARSSTTPYMGADEDTSLSLQMTVNAGADQNFCSSVPVQFDSVKVSGGIPPYTYLWSPSAGLSAANIERPFAAPVTATTYVVTVTDSLGFTAFDSVIVTPKQGINGIVLSAGNPFRGQFNSGTISNPDYSCIGDTVTYGFNPPTGYTNADHDSLWEALTPTLRTPAGNVFDGMVIEHKPTSTSDGYFNIVPSPADDYSVFKLSAPFLYKPSGCIFLVTRYIKFWKSPQINLGSDTAICENASVLLDAGPGFVSYLWSDADSVRTKNLNTAGNTWVMVTDANGCRAVDSLLLTLNPAPSVMLGNDTAICSGQQLQLHAGNSGNSFDWSTGATGDSIQVSSAGSYAVKVTAPNGCSESDTINVSINALPVFTFLPVSPFCDGSSTIINLNRSFASYKWSDNSTGSSLQVVAPGFYKVTVSDSNGCSSSDSVNAIMNPLPVFELGNDTSVCPGNTVRLDVNTAHPVSSWTWSDNSADSFLLATDPGVYAVTAIDPNSCSYTDSIQVMHHSLPPLTLGNDTSICAGSDIKFKASAGYASYLWSNGDTTEEIQVSTAGTYKVQVKTFQHCNNEDSIKLGINSLPVVSLGADRTICPNDSVVLDAGPGFSAYEWSTTGILRTIKVSAPAVYSVMVTDTNGCSAKDSVEISNFPAVSAAFTYQNVQGSEYNFTANGQAAGYAWDFGDGVYGNLDSLNHIFTNNGNFNVRLIVISSDGCIDSSTQVVSIINASSKASEGNKFSLVAFPNPFTDHSTILYVLPTAATVNLEVTDITGRKLLQTVDKLQPAGEYQFSLNAFDLYNASGIYLVKLKVNGQVNVIRVLEVK